MGEGVELPARRQVIPLLNPDIVRSKGRPKGAISKKNTLLISVIMIPRPGVEVIAALTAAIRDGRGQGRGRGGGRERNPLSSTRRDLFSSEIDPYKFLLFTALTRILVQKQLYL